MSDANPEPIIPGAQYTQVQITIHPSALTGMSTIDDTTKKLTSTLAGIADTINLVPSLSPQAYGRIVHEAFALAVRLGKFRGIGFFDVETTYSLELNPRYGSKGSIRTDVVLRNDAGDIIAIYDVKTGGATIKPKRAAELRAKTRVGVNVPLIELHVLRGVTRKSAYLGIYCVRILRGRHQLTNW